ncbi:hypothetical protein GLOTRDRAFT_104066 [Gloeophyllum trabeum ATCC 11539]|uniref:Uncharacterized protein n=1 Tax=Gloeophyllum trabeum (strain ATCC 11539 / FP-39264 / Madison 617) TaxID=670483 RepID=S7QEA1_GLOTA|nr:uncharacterized protein GLOTRDRAFT_104066 [Gloeophyllum trabeum ATCC 11539]EPQ58136.1 hypothetical protein GLOTRDRAFT_104066 [Gloeophyllum trabeum ATCC 11539]
MAVERFLGTRAQRLFLATKTVAVLVMVAITFRLVEEHVNLNETRYKTIPCYLALFALAEVFEILLALDALRLRNVIQLAGILLFHCALIVFAALQIHETKDALNYDDNCAGQIYCNGVLWRRVQPYLIVAPCIIGVSWLVLMFFVRELYFEFGWAIFHVVGANPKMKTMYQFYQVMVCLLKFNFFCFAGVTMQMLILVLASSSAEFGVTIAAVPVVLFLLVACAIAVQREIKWLMSVSLVLMLGAEAYLYKLIRFYEPSSSWQYLSTRATLTFFTVASFLLLFATFAIGLRCFADFDKGLKYSKVYGSDLPTKGKYSSNAVTPLGDSDERAGMAERQSSYVGGSRLQPRISIE